MARTRSSAAGADDVESAAAAEPETADETPNADATAEDESAEQQPAGKPQKYDERHPDRPPRPVE